MNVLCVAYGQEYSMVGMVNSTPFEPVHKPRDAGPGYLYMQRFRQLRRPRS